MIGNSQTHACPVSRDSHRISPSSINCTEVYQRNGTLVPVATQHPRIQVTVDEELGQALARIDAAPSSRSRLVRDLALRGARAVEQERTAAGEALTVLLEIADGSRDYNIEAPAELISRRGDRLP